MSALEAVARRHDLGALLPAEHCRRDGDQPGGVQRRIQLLPDRLNSRGSAVTELSQLWLNQVDLQPVLLGTGFDLGVGLH